VHVKPYGPEVSPASDDVLDALMRRAELHEMLTEPGGGTVPISPADLCDLVSEIRALRVDPQAVPRAVSTCPDTPRLTLAGAVEAAIEKWERIWGDSVSTADRK
jgi:hypothetical protein